MKNQHDDVMNYVIGKSEADAVKYINDNDKEYSIIYISSSPSNKPIMKLQDLQTEKYYLYIQHGSVVRVAKG
jgi:hypothetical protein